MLRANSLLIATANPPAFVAPPMFASHRSVGDMAADRRNSPVFGRLSLFPSSRGGLVAERQKVRKRAVSSLTRKPASVSLRVLFTNVSQGGIRISWTSEHEKRLVNPSPRCLLAYIGD